MGAGANKRLPSLRIKYLIDVYKGICATMQTAQTPRNADAHSNTDLSRLQHLRHWRRGKLSAEYSIPKPARDTKAVLVVHEMML